MLIGIDASRANRGHKSGTEWYSYYLIKALAKIDKTNQYILYTDQPLIHGLLDLSCAKANCSRTDIQYDEDGYQKLISPHNNFKAKIVSWPFKYFWTLGALSLEMLRAKPDVLFIPAHGLPLIHPQKTVATIHDIGFKQEKKLYNPERLGYRLKGWDWLIGLVTFGKHKATSLDYLDWSTDFALKQAKAIITISEFSKQELIKHYQATPNKIKVIHNGYNDELFNFEPKEEHLSAVLQTYGIERPYIFYVGRLEKKKNIAKLIEAYALARQNFGVKHKLYLVGDASYGYDEIKYLIHEFAVDRYVVTTGWIEESHLPFIFKGGDAFIFPSKYEGFGIPLLQAMAAGTPIAASNIASIPEIAGKSALYFNPDDAYDIAEKIANLIQNKSLAKDLIKNGLERSQDFSWEKCAKDTLDLLENI
jgi:glycosyltransferase involved in cell wall biosynthesis